MRKDFDTGQTGQKITYRQLYSMGNRLTSFLLCVALLGTLFMKSPNMVAASTEAEDVPSETEADFPLSEQNSSSTDEGQVETPSEANSDESTPATVDSKADQSTRNDDVNVATGSVATGDADDTSEEVPIVTNTSAGSSSDPVTATTSPADDTDNVAGQIDETSSTTNTAASSTSDQSIATSSDAITTTTDDMPTENIVDDEVADTVVNNESDNEDEITASSTASTDDTDPADAGDGSVVYTSASDDSMMQFDRTKCTPVAGGSYYCQSSDSNDDGRQTTVPDGIHALPDADGDLEIFMVQDGEFTQLTFNTTDDAAPSYDSVSNTVVWHRSINDRYQIMVYDFATKAEKQLTNDTVNNMQPVQSGDFIAWQRWVDSNWQIMLYDGETTTQLTHANHHNIAPAIRGNYVLWKQQRSNDEQTVEVYDLQSRQQYTISDPDGGVISNPRMMLLYESEFANGDVVTRGLDLATNEIVPIQNNPIPLPEDIPSSEPLDEVRALVTKTTNEDDDDSPDSSEPTKDPDTATTTEPVVAPGDIVMTDNASTTELAAATTTTATSTADDVDMTVDLRSTPDEDMISEYDVFVAPYASSSTEIAIEEDTASSTGANQASSTTGAS